MPTHRYSVTPQPIETILSWVKSGEIAIPEIQRPFVWDATKVRNLLDSLYQGYPVGYLIAWRNPNVKLKDGTTSAGKRILIDGQQRVTALMAALLGRKVLTKNYESVFIRIAFNPQTETFEVANPAIAKDVAWILDLAEVFAPDRSFIATFDEYMSKNPEADRDHVSQVLQKLDSITANQVGIIELAEDLDIETVTEIFIRVNSAGAELSQADFAMSKISVNEVYGGNQLRKAIDYFCHLAVAPDFYSTIAKNDTAFAATDFLPKMKWLTTVNDDLYDPTYTDMLRVAFTAEFRRGRLQDLVALLSGRNFETKQFEDAIVEDSFTRLRKGIVAYMNQTNFERMVMILRSAGFETRQLIGGHNPINFSYVLYLRGRDEGMDAAALERMVRRWYAMSILTGRYAGSPEGIVDSDIRAVDALGITTHVDAVLSAELPDTFWTGILPQSLSTSSSSSQFTNAFLAAQCKLQDRGFLSRDVRVRDMVLSLGDLHHVYPKNHLKAQGLSAGRYNQIANLVMSQTEINIAISDKAPAVYFDQLRQQCSGGPALYGGITDLDDMKVNLKENCLPVELLDGQDFKYDEFLEMRRVLMAEKLRRWFVAL